MLLHAALLENASIKLQLAELQKIALQLLRRNPRAKNNMRSSSLPAMCPSSFQKFDIQRLARCFEDEDDASPIFPAPSSAAACLPNQLPATPTVPLGNALHVPVCPSNNTPWITKSAPVTPTMQSSSSVDDIIQWDNLDCVEP